MTRTLHRLSTEEVAPARRARFWRDAIHQSVVEMDLRPTDSEAFFGYIELCPLTSIAPHQACGSAQRVSRDTSEIARGSKNAYYLISQPRLPWQVRHAGQSHLVQPGESVLVDTRLPYEFEFHAGLDDLSVEMPSGWLESWIARPARLLGKPLNASHGWGLALRGVKEAMVPRLLTGLPVPDALLQDQLGALLALASGEHLDQPMAMPGLLERFTQAMRERIAEPGLVASQIAEDCAASSRTLHRCFSASSQTFASVLMRLRIERAEQMLSDRRFSCLTLAEIGRRCGFLDPSHFARQFRRQRGRGPREYRATAIG